MSLHDSETTVSPSKRSAGDNGLWADPPPVTVLVQLKPKEFDKLHALAAGVSPASLAKS